MLVWIPQRIIAASRRIPAVPIAVSISVSVPTTIPRSVSETIPTATTAASIVAPAVVVASAATLGRRASSPVPVQEFVSPQDVFLDHLRVRDVCRGHLHNHLLTVGDNTKIVREHLDPINQLLPLVDKLFLFLELWFLAKLLYCALASSTVHGMQELNAQSLHLVDHAPGVFNALGQGHRLLSGLLGSRLSIRQGRLRTGLQLHQHASSRRRRGGQLEDILILPDDIQ